MSHNHNNHTAQERRWTEEFKVAGDDLVEMVKKFAHEANVRRIIIQASDGRRLLDIPVWVGVGGAALLPMLSALLLIAGMVTGCSIIVERAEPEVA